MTLLKCFDGTATPSTTDLCVVFSPPSIHYGKVSESLTSENYTPEVRRFNISGHIYGLEPYEYIQINFVPIDPGSNTLAWSNGDADYETFLPCGWTGIATPTSLPQQPPLTFEPPSWLYTTLSGDYVRDYTATR
jgi:hypothetical protein